MKSYSEQLFDLNSLVRIDNQYLKAVFKKVVPVLQAALPGGKYRSEDYLKSLTEIINDPKNHGKSSLAAVDTVQAIDCDQVERTVHPKGQGHSVDLCVGIGTGSGTTSDHQKSSACLLLIELKLGFKSASSLRFSELQDKFNTSRDFFRGCDGGVKCYPRLMVVCAANKTEVVRRAINRYEKAGNIEFKSFAGLTDLSQLEQRIKCALQGP